MWLTKYENPYGSGSLNRLLEDLCEHAGIAKRPNVVLDPTEYG
jgi:hypothetical protein